MVAGNPTKFIGYTEDFYKKIKEKYDTQSCGMATNEKNAYLLSLPEEKFIKKSFMQMPKK